MADHLVDHSACYLAAPKVYHSADYSVVHSADYLAARTDYY